MEVRQILDELHECITDANSELMDLDEDIAVLHLLHVRIRGKLQLDILKEEKCE